MVAETNKMIIDFCRFLLVAGLIMIMVLNKCGRCEVYSVGGDQGWNMDTNFGAWSKDYNFTVGDILAFRYEKEQHNVYEVTERAYRTCDTRSGVIAKYESGNDKVKLTEQKKYWFLCNVVGHCFGGMRFHIDVISKSTNSTSDALLTPPLIHSSSSSTTSHFFYPFPFFIHHFFVFSILSLF